MDLTATSLIAIASVVVHLVSIAIVYRYQDSAEQPIIRLLLVTLGLGLLNSLLGTLATGTELFGQEALSQSALMVYVGSLFLVMYSVLTTNYLQQKQVMRLWVAGGLLWWGVLVLAGLSEGAFTDPEWFTIAVDEGGAAQMLAIVGWLAGSALLFWIAFWKYYTARLPELANQALYWGVVMPLVTVGMMLSSSSVEFLQEMGWLIGVVGIAGITYGIIALRVLDIRETMRNGAVAMALTLVTAIVIIISLLVAEDVETSTSVSREVVLVGLAAAAATLHAPLYIGADYVLKRSLRQSTGNATSNINRFSEAITGIVELTELNTLVDETIRDGMQTRRSELLLVTNDAKDENLIHIEPYHANVSENMTPTTVLGSLKKDGVMFKQLKASRRPVLQYAIDFSKEFADVVPEEKQFFQRMRMGAYAPIIVHDDLIGILTAGPKSNDAPFSEDDLNLLSAVANQTGIALRNARLVSDLRKREHDLESTNTTLESAKRRLEAMDAVKTDFITIASHELRTPLAQIRGHSDIIAALSDQGALTPEHLGSLTSKLRAATDRLETLIGDMLDVSRLDLSALDLRFTQSSVENVVRLAIEPLQESIRERKQSLTAKGLRNLPQIEADTKRLVQAVRNLVLNAVKFTPDGGRIEIHGELLNNPNTGKDELKLTVKDTGIGIDKKHHEAIFEKFFRIGDPGLHSTGATKFMGAGPGLGLTIAKGVIEGHGGRISVESEKTDPEELPGSIFIVILPLKPPEGSRRVLGFGANEVPGVVASGNGSASANDESDNPGVFEEHDPTVLNPAASRAGLAAAAQAAVAAMDEKQPETSKHSIENVDEQKTSAPSADSETTTSE